MEGPEGEKNQGPVRGLTEEQKHKVVGKLAEDATISLTPKQLDAVRKKYPPKTLLTKLLADIVAGRTVVPKSSKK